MRSKCSQKRGPPYACEPLTNQGGWAQGGQGGQSGLSPRPLRLFSPWAGGTSHDSRRPSPMPYYALPCPTHPVPSSWLSLSPYTSAYITRRTYSLPPNIHAWWFAGQRFTPINFQFRVGGLTFQRLLPSSMFYVAAWLIVDMIYLLDNCNMFEDEIQIMFVCKLF